MKGYVVTLMNMPESVEIARRCVLSGKQYNIDISLFPAVYKDNAIAEMGEEQLTLGSFDKSFSHVEAVIGNFITQYRIWKKILSDKVPGIVLEHDAIFISALPSLADHGDIINLGKPSYGSFRVPTNTGIYPLFSKPGGYIPGAHGYYVTPAGAQQLIEKARALGVSPCDVFLNNRNFPRMMEIYPWVVEAKDKFSTIQKEKGCKAKHNYSKNYKIL